MPSRNRAAATVVMLLAAIAHGADGPATQPAGGKYGPVELIRDRWGIPHVFARTDAGAMYGLGYATARERGFQMHFNLRIIQGRAAEVLGGGPRGRGRESVLEQDRKMRTFGFHRAARALVATLDADTLAMLEAYSDGVNAGMAAMGERRHPLFARLGLEPEPWTPADCIASWWHLGQFFATDGTRELLHWHTETDPAAPDRPRPPVGGPRWFDDAAAVVGREDVTDEWLERVTRFMREHGLSPSSQPATQGGPKFSHAWVVGGKKLTTGSAVLVSDPQTPVRNPSLWQEFHVCGATFNARGIGVAGSPALLIGWTEHIAWGLTALGADQADLFRLKTDRARPNQYMLDGQWKDMEVTRETIKVKDAPAVEIVIRQTRFGPVVTPFAFARPDDPEVALKRVPMCQTDGETVQAVLAMMRAKDAAELCKAAGRWRFPSANMVFGDKQGNVGFRVVGSIPVRSPQDEFRGAAAVDGSTAKLDWQGFMPPELVPQVLNPKRGWIASANHRAIGAFYPAALGLSTGSMGDTVRSWRLRERLAPRDKFEPKDVLDVHFDDVNPARREIARLGYHLRDVQKAALSPEATRVLAALEPWRKAGCRMDRSVEGARTAEGINTFFRFMATPLAAIYGGGESGLCRFLREAGARLEKDARAEFNAEEVAFIDKALAAAMGGAGGGRGGEAPARGEPAASRPAGDALRATPASGARPAPAGGQGQRMAYFDSLDGLGSVDPACDLTAPDLACMDGATIRSQGAQSFTQYVPLHDVDSAMSLLPIGHGERADDPYRTSTMKLWERGELHPAPLSHAAVEKIAAERVTLK